MRSLFERYGKIIGAIVISFFIVKTVTPALFIAGTPKYNPAFLTRLKETVSDLDSKRKVFLASLFKSGSKTPAPANTPATAKYLAPAGFNPEQVIFSQVSKGVYAGEDKITKKKYVKIDNDVKVNVTEYTINGQVLTLYELAGK